MAEKTSISNPVNRERSPIHIRKVSPMFRKNAIVKPTLNLGGLDQSDEEDNLTNSEKKHLGENPFDGTVINNIAQNEHIENMRNLFFHQRPY